MKGAIEVLRNIRAMCSTRDHCVGCPLDNRCPGVKAPDLWSDEMIYTICGLPRYDDITHECAECPELYNKVSNTLYKKYKIHSAELSLLITSIIREITHEA